ncbi:MAG: glycosyltransferase family 2 protein, partial [Rikenellaceae bacterium]
PRGVDVVVVDNGSTDSSVGVLKREFESVRVVELGENYGFAAGYNEALRRLDYECYVLLNSDVEVTEGWCAPLLGELYSSEDVGAVSPKILSCAEPSKFEYAGASGGYIDILGYPFCRGRILKTTEVDEGQYDDARDLFWVSGAAFAIRAEVFEQMGGFDADFFAHMEEIDLCWRLQLRGYRVRVVPQSVVYHLGGGTLAEDSPSKIYLNHRNNLAMLYKCASPGQRALVAVVRPVLDMAAAVSYLVKGRVRNFWAVFRAYGSFVKWHFALANKRREVRAGVVEESRYIYRGSIVWRYLWGLRRYSDM